MHYSTAAQRERSKQFETFVGNGLEAIANPEVAATIGWMGLKQMKGLLEKAVLPNVGSSKITLTASQLFKDGVAILPLSYKHGAHVEAMMGQSEDYSRYIWAYPRHNKYSKRYNYTFGGKSALLPKSRDSTLNSKTALIQANQAARTTANWSERVMSGKSKDHGKIFERTRPWILVHPKLFEYDGGLIGATALHEIVHCQDMIDDGPLMYNRRYIGSSELRAYHVASTVLEVNGIIDPLVSEIESARLEDSSNISPFVPSDNMLRWMQKNDYLGQ